MIETPPKTKFKYQAALFFLEAGHYLFCNYETKRKSSKFVTAPDVAAAFAGQEQDTGWFPAGILRCGHNAQGDWFVYSAPVQKVAVVLEGEEPLIIPIPRTVLLGVGSEFHLWAIQEEHFRPNADGYAAPFPNVHGDGKICWGSNKPPAAQPGNARIVWELFFATPFNKHLANDKSRAYPRDVTERLRELAGKKRYPTRDLIGLRTTIGNLINQVIETRR